MLTKQLVDAVNTRIDEILPRVIDFRHELHAHPEIGLDTVDTKKRVQDFLSQTSITQLPSTIGNDLIAELKGNSGRRICLRADMDALPIQEESGRPYSSQIPCRMHACGHDGHTAMLAGTALILDSLKDSLPVTVRFVFQPGEESIAAGRTMVEKGAINGCEATFAIHGWPAVPLGCVTTRVGALMAAGSHFEIKITGKGCHGAMPEKGNNPIPIAAKLAGRLYDLHNELNARDGSVVSVCSFWAGTSDNIIPETATLLGTARYVRADVGDEVERRIRSITEATVRDAGASVEIEYTREYDLPVLNTPKAVDLVKSLAQTYLPAGCWKEAEKPSMAMEDFAYYLKDREGALMFLGVGMDSPNLHNPTYDFSDDAIRNGLLMLTLIALSQ